MADLFFPDSPPTSTNVLEEKTNQGEVKQCSFRSHCMS